MSVRHYQDKRAGLARWNHHLQDQQSCHPPHLIRRFHSNRRCDSDQVRSRVTNRMLLLQYPNNPSILLLPATSPVHPEVAERHSRMEEDEVVIEEGMGISIRRSAVLLPSMLRMDTLDMDNRCMIQCSPSGRIYRCMEGDLCPLLPNPRLWFRA